MSTRTSYILAAIVIMLAMIGWHYTPWSAMGMWGPIGCHSALKNAGIWPKGCGEKPKPCEE